MKYSTLLSFILLSWHLFGQNHKVQLPDNLGGPPVYKVTEERIVNKLEAFEKYTLEELTPNSQWWYHLTLSSCKLYLDRDSSLYHFRQAYKIMPKATCEDMRIRHNTFIKTLQKEKEEGIVDPYIEVIRKETGKSEFSWYLWDLPDFDEFTFIDTCNQKYPIQNVKFANTKISETIRIRDQKNRNNLQEQELLDQINRDYVDSLYLIKESLDEFAEEEIYQISMVTHHSEDCDWVYKWTERLIDHYEKGYEGKTLLGPLIERMFKKNDGYCTKQDPQKRDYFIYMIKGKYPKFVKMKKIKW